MKVNRFVYQWEINLHIPDIDDPIETMIESAQMRLNFDNYIFPVLKVKLGVEQKYIPLIEKNKKFIYAGVTITCIQRGRDEDNPNEVDVEISSDIIHKGMYLPLFVEETFPSDKGHINEGEEPEEDELDRSMAREDSMAIPVSIEAFLYDTQGLRFNKEKMFNFVADGESGIDTVLLKMINALPSYVHTVILDKPSNENEYPEIRGPFYNFRNSLVSLQKRYGIYDSGLLIFYIFGKLFILNKYAVDYDYADGDYSRVVLKVEPTDESMGSYTSFAFGEDDSVIYECGTKITPVDVTTVVGEKSGDNVIFSNSESVANAIAYDENNKHEFKNPGVMIKAHDDTHRETGTKVNHVFDELNNPFNFVSEMRENSPGDIISLYIPSVDMMSFLPNKIFELNVINDDELDKKRRGVYRLHSASLDFMMTSVETQEMSCAAAIVLMKKKTGGA